MTYGPLLLWYSWADHSDHRNTDELYGLQTFNFQVQGNALMNPPELLSLFIRYEQLIPAGILIEKKAIIEAGGYVNTFRGNYEDAVLLVKVCLKYKVYVSNECLYKYRQHPHNSSRIVEKAGKYWATQLAYLNWVKKYLSDQEIEDPQVWKALESAYFPHKYPLLFRLTISFQQMFGKLESFLIKIGKSILPGKTRSWLWEKWVGLKTK